MPEDHPDLSSPKESAPLLPLHHQPISPSSSRLSGARIPWRDKPRRLMSEKTKGKQRAMSDLEDQAESSSLLHNPYDDQLDSPVDEDEHEERGDVAMRKGKGRAPPKKAGRCVTIIFSGEEEGTSEGNLEIWVDDGESVGSVKDQIRLFRKATRDKSLRIIHSGRLLTDGILLVGWIRSLEERVKRQAGSMGTDVESVLKDVGLAEEEDEREGKGEGGERVWLHCVVGGKVEEKVQEGEEEPSAPRRRGFDVLLDAGLSPADVAAMRRQFYESRGEEVPDDMGETNDEHTRALEEQWIEGDLTAETATISASSLYPPQGASLISPIKPPKGRSPRPTSLTPATTEGMFTSILHGLLTGFLFPITPWFFFREAPLPNFFDADAEADRVDEGGVSGQVAESGVGGEVFPSVVFGKRMQMGILFGTVLNLAFGALRFLN